ncbi:MAG: response regulator [Gammaproteobacteria bacterium]|nr:response regulator [Gammaproteobacteria bacterium]MDH5730434.1 response regulator [Gammaproteobacteria bacterium]
MIAGDINVLIVDDDPDIREMLHDYLQDNGFQVTLAIDADSMRNSIENQVPDVVLMDVGLPGNEDGLSLTRYLRERLDIGVIVISGAGDTVDRIVGLEVGADDYIAKPFDPRELKARIKSVIRRYQRIAASSLKPEPQSTGDEIIQLGNSRLNLVTRQLHNHHGEEIPLTAMEFDLLKTFVERPKRPMTRDQLLNITQNRDWDPFDRSIDIRITRLRRKIESDPNKPQLIRTVRGIGYMYVPLAVTVS